MAIRPCIISGGIILFILSRTVGPTLIKRSIIFAFEVSAYFNTRYNRNEPQFIGFLGTSINYYNIILLYELLRIIKVQFFNRQF